jgi:hypothetical protein
MQAKRGLREKGTKQKSSARAKLLKTRNDVFWIFNKVF